MYMYLTAILSNNAPSALYARVRYCVRLCTSVYACVQCWYIYIGYVVHSPQYVCVCVRTYTCVSAWYRVCMHTAILICTLLCVSTRYRIFVFLTRRTYVQNVWCARACTRVHQYTCTRHNSISAGAVNFLRKESFVHKRVRVRWSHSDKIIF